MKAKPQFWIAFFLVAASTLACQLLNPSIAADQYTTPTQPARQSPVKSPESIVLYQEDFSNPSSGWDTRDDDKGVTGYVDHGYQIKVNTPKYYLWSTAGKKFADTTVEVDTTRVSGSAENDMAIICRYQDKDNFYFLSVGSDGYYGITRFKDSKDELIGMEKMRQSGAVKTDSSSVNHIRVDCVKDKLTLSVNGVELISTTDSSFSSGDVGLLVGSYDEPGVDILFQNFIVKRPQP